MEKISKEIIKQVIEIIKDLHKTATGYEPEKNLRSESDLEHIVYEAIKLGQKISHGNDRNPNNAEVGTFLMHEITTRHPFFDGNKRTALMTFLYFRYIELSINLTFEKIDVHFPKSWDNKDDKVVNFMLELAQRKYTYDEALKFVRETFK
ncbi:MAG: Fic family protein [Nanoarchaeota archaeon]|nr:Fic family protein [Nanoarchaeota archaeon]MBU4299822.1 Fic family protein [Nanoarchaeota archaeon]MBU4451291.1 Fic family protein [Nanoarchaeota archaeon]MCG2723580.1 Fic family protein [archaeon]